MASAGTIPPTHVEASLLQDNNEEGEPDDSNWPSLNPEKESTDEWEMVPPATPQVTFHVAFPDETKRQSNSEILKHCQSSPNLREYELADDNDSTSQASSSMVMVAGPASVWSVGSNRLSFKDAILQPPAQSKETKLLPNQTKKVIKKVKPIFVVKPIKRQTHSTGDLRALATHEEEILGDTDAHEYYSRKSQGAVGRKNGMKTRPDEAKRLQMTMAKKNMQRQRQGARGSWTDCKFIGAEKSKRQEFYKFFNWYRQAVEKKR